MGGARAGGNGYVAKVDSKLVTNVLGNLVNSRGTNRKVKHSIFDNYGEPFRVERQSA